MQDKSIPLIEVVESFDIFDVANKGATGKAIRPTHAALANTFGTSDTELIISKILETGKVLQITAKGRNDMSKDLI
jgi:ribosome maturation protein Sdo1